MRRHRKSLMSEVDLTDKKLNKMSPEDKNLRQQISIFLDLREQIRVFDVKIMNEEISLSNWKRTKAREWMDVLFGGLLQCSRKGAVVATFGHAIVGCVSTGEETNPGSSGHSQIGPLVAEAERELHKILFVGEVGVGTLQPLYESRSGDPKTKGTDRCGRAPFVVDVEVLTVGHSGYPVPRSLAAYRYVAFIADTVH